MGKAAMAKDLYLQFFNITTTLDATDTSDVQQVSKPTGLGVRGQLIYLIHLIEVWWPWIVGNHVIEATLTTRAGLAAGPNSDDPGTILKAGRQQVISTQGGYSTRKPEVFHYLPPIPLAAPQLTLYSNTGIHQADLGQEEVMFRMGFTTAPLDAAAYTEIAEVWGW